MTQVVHIHPTHPQLRLVRHAVETLNQGGVIVYPTDSAYALGCRMGDRDAIERIRRIRGLSKMHNFTLMCRDLSELSTYARVDNPSFRLLKAYTPGPYTFVLQASKEVPRLLQNPKRKTIGLRVPDHAITLALLEEVDEAIMSVTLIPPGGDLPMSDMDEIIELVSNQVDLIVDGGPCGLEATTVLDLTSGAPEVLRVGKGDISEL